MKNLILFILLTLASNIFGTGFQVINNAIMPDKGQISFALEVSNQSNEMKAYSVNIETRDHNENGDEINELAGESFIIDPDQIILEPFEKKRVSVIYYSDKTIQNESVYRVSISEVEIPKFDYVNSNLKIVSLSKIKKNLYVSPKNEQFDYTEPSLMCNSNVCYISMENKGSSIVYLKLKGFSIDHDSNNVKKLDYSKILLVLPGKNLKHKIALNFSEAKYLSSAIKPDYEIMFPPKKVSKIVFDSEVFLNCLYYIFKLFSSFWNR